ncbi:MAG: hypothetical protein AAF513_05255 [Pseudomonadota bacterium]
MTPAKAQSSCAHLARRPDLKILWVLDSHVHWTDAYARCCRCEQAYLLETFDLRGNEALLRIAALPPVALQATLRSLRSGSCDLERARAETMHLASAATPTALVLRMHNGELIETLPCAVELPTRNWRELPCDGAWFKRLHAQTL